MKIRIKKTHPDATIPDYAHFGDAAVDLVAIRKWEDNRKNLCYGTGLAMEIPKNHVGLCSLDLQYQKQIFVCVMRLE